MIQAGELNLPPGTSVNFYFSPRVVKLDIDLRVERNNSNHFKFNVLRTCGERSAVSHCHFMIYLCLIQLHG